MASDRRTSRIDNEILELIFNRIKEKALRRVEDEKHAASRHQRRAIDALRSRIKHLEPPVRASDSWEQVKVRVEKTDEYRALDSDEPRRAAFEKVIRRLKEKEEDAEKDREPKDKDRRSRRDYERDYRNGHSYRDRRAASGRLSRTPEPDAYEADRRKAQADRERSYRKASGLSPSSASTYSRDRRDDRDRERERDRPSSRHPSHYDRDRLDRDDEREKVYRSRADPRSGRDELDYGAGDTGGTSSGPTSERRRRRDSETESVESRSAKRYRRDTRESERPGESSSKGLRKDRDRREDERTSGKGSEALAIKEERAVHSGSEEGEIEEE